jgi:hypothetical protein
VRDVPWGCGKKNKPRRPSAGVMCICYMCFYICRPIYNLQMYKGKAVPLHAMEALGGEEV